MPFTYYTDNVLINELLGGVVYPPPATVYVGLSTTAPVQGGTGITEPSGNGYARVAVTNNTTNFPNATNGAKSNGATITFPTSTGSWGVIPYFFIADALTGGNILLYGTLNNSQTISSGDTLIFNTGQLTVSVA